jgi:OOP family OmpA-OmpF porin
VSTSGGSHAARGAALALAMLAVPALALHPEPEADATGEHLAFGGFFEFPDSGRGVDHGTGVHYGYGRLLDSKRAWELRVFGGTRETGVDGATDFYHYGAGGDLFQYFGDTTVGHPFALVGLGAVLSDVDPDDEDGFSGYAGVGAGWRMAPLRNWGLRPRFELRASYDSFDSGQVDFLLGAALEIPARREKRVEVEKIVEVPVPAAPPPDFDGDGVPDASDQCPGTVPGAKVEPDGCVRKAQVVVLPNIEFAYKSAELAPPGRETADQVVRFMNDQPEIVLEVWGHTDSRGSDVYNLNLSQRRAAAVVQYLVDKGIEARRLKSAGFGESRPLADNATEEGRERNRRVELNIRASAGGKP